MMRALTGVLLVGAAVLQLVAGVLAIRAIRLPFPGLFVEPTLVVNELGDPNWPGYAAGFHHPQWLVALDGRPLQTPTALIEALSAYQVGDRVVLTATDVTGARLEAAVPLMRMPWETVINLFLLPHLLGWAFLIIGAWVYRLARQQEAPLVFAATCAVLALPGGLIFDLATTHRLWWAWVASLPLAGGLALHLASIFPRRLGLVHRVRWLPLLAYLPALFITVASIVTTTRMDTPTAYFDPWFWGMLYAGVGVAGLLASMALHRYLSPSPLIRSQARTAFLGTLVGAGPFALWVVVTRWLNVPFAPLLILPPLVLFPLSMAYVLLQRRALDIDWVLRRTATYLAMTALTVGFYLLLVLAVAHLFNPPLSPFHPGLLILFAILTALGAQPTRLAVQRLFDRLLLGRRITPEQALHRLAEQLTASRNEDDVIAAVSDVVRQALSPQFALFYRLDERSGWYVPRLLCGDTTHLVRFRSDSPLAQRLTGDPAPLFLAVQGGLPPELESEQDRLSTLGPTLFIPLVGYGWLALGPTRAQRFRAADLRFAETIAPQVTAAMERVRLTSDLERRVTELEALRFIAQAASYSVDFDDLLELIYAQTSRVLDTSNFFISLYDPETRTLRFSFYVEEGERRYPNDVWSDERGLTGYIVRTGNPIITTDYLSECQRLGVEPGGRPGKAWMGMPLISRDQVLGVMNVSSFDPDVVYTPEQVNLFRTVADQAAAILDKARLNAQIEERARELEALNEVSSAIASTLDLDVVLDLIVQKASVLVKAAAASLLLVDEATDELVFRVSSTPDLVGVRLPKGTGIVGRVAEQARPLIVNDVQRDERWFGGLDEKLGFGTRSIIAVPMISRGKVIGVLEFINRIDGRPFDAEDRRLLMAFAADAAIAIENARLFTMTDQALAERVEELSMMQRIDRELNATLDYRRVMQITLDWAIKMAGADIGLVAMVVEEGGRRGLRFLANHGYPEDLISVQDGELWPLDRGVIGRTVQVGEPRLEEAGLDSRYLPAVPGMVAQLTVPIRREQEVIGVISVESSRRGVMNQETIALMTRLADHAAIAIENARLFEETRRRLQEQTILSQASAMVLSSLNLQEVLFQVARQIGLAVDATSAYICEWDREKGTATIVAEYTAPHATSAEQISDLGVSYPVEEDQITRRLLHEQQAIVVQADDPRLSETVRQHLARYGGVSVLLLPLVIQQQALGFVEVWESRRRRYFSADEITLAQTIANQVAVAIQNARLFQAVQAANEELSMMQRIDRELNTTLDYRRVMEITLDWAVRVVGADIGLLAMVVEAEDGSRGLRFLANRGYPEELVSIHSEQPWPLEKGIVGQTVLTGEPSLVENAVRHPHYFPAVEGMVAQLTVPIRREEKIIGVIALESSQPGLLDQEALQFVTRLADHAAIALENARLFEAVQAANNAKTEFISFVSHELKQPMTSMKGYTDLLIKGTAGELNEMQLSFLEVIRTNVARMDTLVQDLLDVARIEAGRLRLEISKVEMAAAIEDAVRSVRQQIEAKGQALEVVTEEPLPPVSADRNRLVQVLTNLLSNAYKYTPEGGRICIRAGKTDGHILCSVSDTGIGMTEEEQERLFTKYFRSNNPAVRNVPGTGLGLVITKSLVELQGGTIWVESAPGQGSTFSFTLPVAE